MGEGVPGDTAILGYCEILQIFFKKFNISQVFSNVQDSSTKFTEFPAIPAKFQEKFGKKYLIYWKINNILHKSGDVNEILQNNVKIKEILKIQ